MMSRFFGAYGHFCATHPWEVIVAVTTLTTCLLTVEKPLPNPPCPTCFEEQFKAVDVIIMTVIRCLAILYTSHQFRNLQKIGSKYVLGLAGLFIVFSSFVFTSTVLNFLKIDLIDLKDAMFFFLLLIDLPKAATLAQFALTASSQEEINSKIARGMSVLGPTITLDTTVETLVIAVGTMSGVYRLELLSYFACFSVLVNYVIFMTFYPACLSLLLELTRVSNFYGERKDTVSKMLLEENEKSNPAIQRVKLIMSIGLVAVHVHSRWFLKGDGAVVDKISAIDGDSEACADTFYGLIFKQFALSVDHIFILILLLTLLIKFVFFENEEHARHIQAVALGKVGRIEEAAPQAPILKRQNRIELESITEKEVQTVDEEVPSESDERCRGLEEVLQIYRSIGASQLSDKEVILLVDTKHIPAYNLEKVLGNEERGVRIRRQIIHNMFGNSDAFISLPYRHYDYSKVMGACCENVVGYVPVPLGTAGPLLLDGKKYLIPMATTEGCLVASTNRGCRAVETNGIRSEIINDGMTRAPVVRFNSVIDSARAARWLLNRDNFSKLKEQFDSTSRFAKLTHVEPMIAGNTLHIRFVAETGDAMGMNMLSKGSEKALRYLQEVFPGMEVLSISGNCCTDKKPSAINFIRGRGKSVVCETTIPGDVVVSVLKTNTAALVALNQEKNMVGSALAGSIGGCNAHSANIVTALYIATGQDPAQNVVSSNCLTKMEARGNDLYVSCTMPSVEVGTVGGGTILPAQSACLDLLGVKGANKERPGDNAKEFARIVCAAVLVGELSLMAALVEGALVKSHLQYNRSYSERNTSRSSSSSSSNDQQQQQQQNVLQSSCADK